VFVAYDGSPAADHAVQVAIEIADRDGGRLDVLLLTRRLDEARIWESRLVAAAAGRALGLRFMHAPDVPAADLCATAARLGAALMVLGAGQDMARDAAGRALIERVPCSVLLVR
jgi:nucleotide-binding universal stress UspA family protein